VRSDGTLGLYIGGSAREKADRLIAEGIEVRSGKVDLKHFGFDRFEGDRPLARLREVQEEAVRLVSLEGSDEAPEVVGGVDVSYPAKDEGVAAYALVGAASGELVWSTTIRRPVRFPYISTYLTFRELPILLDLLDEVRRAGRLYEPLLVDGSGILHPRHVGVASHFGVAGSVATVGVTKKLLFGQVDTAAMLPLESRAVQDGSRQIGWAIRPTKGSLRPIFVSPGHRVSVAAAEASVRRMLLGRRLPEPLYWADRLSRAAGRQRPTDG
jgi:deoxyribonuclease V